MAYTSVTYTFTNATTADASQVNQNFTDLINGLSDGTKDLNIAAIVAAGNATFNGKVTLGKASSDDLTITASLASAITIKTTNTYDVGTAAACVKDIYCYKLLTDTIDDRGTGGITCTPLFISSAGIRIDGGTAAAKSIVYASTAININNSGLIVADTGSCTLGADNSAVEHLFRGSGVRIGNTTPTANAGASLAIAGDYNNTNRTAMSQSGASISLQNTDGTTSSFAALLNLDAAGDLNCGIAFVNGTNANNDGSIEFFTRPSGGGAVVLAGTIGSDQIWTFPVSIKLLSTGATASGLNFYAESTFSLQWTPDGAGSGAGTAVTAKVTRVGNVVTITFPRSLTADPAGTTGSLVCAACIPAWARPAYDNVSIILGFDNSAGENMQLVCTSAGSMALYRLVDNTQPNFTNGTNVAGNEAGSVTYIV